MTHSCQRGVALISVLLVTGLALFVVAGLMRSHRMTVQGTAQQLHQQQLRQAALTAESYASQLLLAPDIREVTTIHLGQDWALKAEAFQLPDLDVRLEIEDLAGRFNLTRLVGAGGVDDVTLQRWVRLLSVLDIPAFDLRPLNDFTLTDAAQLQRMPQLKKDDLQRLLPWVAVLPRDAMLNVNTVSAPVMASLEGMTLSAARGLVSQRAPRGYADIESFTRTPGVLGLGVSTHGLSVSSRWFRVSVHVRIADTQLRLISDIERVRNTNRTLVIRRRLVASAEHVQP